MFLKKRILLVNAIFNSIVFPAEIWREYIGYDIDLNLPSILPAPGLVSNDNNYTNVVDGNLATCVQVSEVSCDIGFKVRSFYVYNSLEGYWKIYDCFWKFSNFIRHLLSFWSYCKTVCGVKQNTDSKLRYQSLLAFSLLSCSCNRLFKYVEGRVIPCLFAVKVVTSVRGNKQLWSANPLLAYMHWSRLKHTDSLWLWPVTVPPSHAHFPGTN